jgi:CRAL/TRIO domain
MNLGCFKWTSRCFRRGYISYSSLTPPGKEFNRVAFTLKDERNTQGKYLHSYYVCHMRAMLSLFCCSVVLVPCELGTNSPYAFILDITVDHIVIRLHHRYFTGIYAIIRPWIDPDTAAKFNIIGPDFLPALLEEIDISQIPVDLGGTLESEWTGPWDDSSYCSQAQIEVYLRQRDDAVTARRAAASGGSTECGQDAPVGGDSTETDSK